MPNVYTRTGDAGLTGLFGGSRVPKQDPGVEAYGTVDEANSAIGEAKAVAMDESVRATLHGIQQRLFVVAAELASDAKGREILANTVGPADVKDLEDLIDMCQVVTGPQREFVVPGRDVPSAALHRARTVTRRAERRVLTMAETIPVRPDLIKYLNRLSDTLYALARLTEHHHDLVMIEQVVRAAVVRALGGTGAGVRAYDLSTLKVMAAAAEAKATELGVPIVFAAVDEGGNLMLLHRTPTPARWSSSAAAFRSSSRARSSVASGSPVARSMRTSASSRTQYPQFRKRDNHDQHQP